MTLPSRGGARSCRSSDTEAVPAQTLSITLRQFLFDIHSAPAHSISHTTFAKPAIMRPLHYALLGVFGLVAAQFDNVFEFTEGPLSPALGWYTGNNGSLGGWSYFDSIDSLQSGGPRTGFTAHMLLLDFVGSGFRVHGKLDTGTNDLGLGGLGKFWVMPNVTRGVNITQRSGVVAEWGFAGAVRPMVVNMRIPDNVSFTLYNVTTLIPVSTEAYVNLSKLYLTPVPHLKHGKRQPLITQQSSTTASIQTCLREKFRQRIGS